MQLNWIVNTLYFLWTGNIMEWLYLPFCIFIFLHHYLILIMLKSMIEIMNNKKTITVVFLFFCFVFYAVLKITYSIMCVLFPVKYPDVRQG